MDVNYMHPAIKDQGTVVIHTIFWQSINLRLTRPSGPIRYSILINMKIFRRICSWASIRPFQIYYLAYCQVWLMFSNIDY